MTTARPTCGVALVTVTDAVPETPPLNTWRPAVPPGPIHWVGGQDARGDTNKEPNGDAATGADAGGLTLDVAPPDGAEVSVAGYVGGAGDVPVSCTASVYDTAGYPTFDCPGFDTGTSGSPWVLASNGVAEVVGVIGGLHGGGCSADTSYSAPFTQACVSGRLVE